MQPLARTPAPPDTDVLTGAILVVDDRQANRDLLVAFLSSGGYRVLAAPGAEEALELARAERPGLIVSDVLMPAMNGFELVRRLRAEPGLERTQVVFCTAHYDDREVREIATALGVDAMLPKPFTGSAVLETVADVLGRSERVTPLVPPERFDSEHTRVLSEKLVEKADELELARVALRASEDRFRLLVSNIPGAVYRRAGDADLTIEFVTDGIEEITGYAARSLVANRERSYGSIVHPDDRERVAEEMHAAAAAGRHYGLAYRIVRADGAEAWVGDKGQAVLDDDGVWLYGTVSDVTERKRLEADRNQMELELRMAQKLEAVGQLAAGVAHEINTPIQFVGDSVQFLKDCFDDLEKLLAEYRHVCTAATLGRAGDTLRARLRQAEEEADLGYLEERVPAAFERTLDGIERVASIVRALKEFSHPQTDQAPADLNQALATTLIVARNEYKYAAEVETEFGELPPVVCNLSDLNQVFLNLIVNAAHAIEDAQGGSREKGTIRIRTAREDELALISISDTGAGIPKEIRTRIFDPFFTTKPVGRGSGQGLAIARAVVDKHGGTLEFESELAAGTTFVIRLPIAGAGMTAERPAA